MSQEKVDLYKASKAGRKGEAKKRKQKRFIRWTAAVVVICAIVVWLGVSVYQHKQEALPRASVNADIESIATYEMDLSQLVGAEEAE